MVVRFFSNYASSESLLQRFRNNYFITDNIISFTIGEDYDVAVVFNKTYDSIKSGAKIITVIQEPSWSPVHNGNDFLYNSDVLIIHHAHEFRKLGYSIGGEVLEEPSFMWFHDHVEKELFFDTDKVRKNRKLSMIVSSINFPIGNYQKRVGLVEKILDSDLEIDIYGYGWNINDRRFKGQIEYKYQGLIPYEYTICIENSNEQNYVTEKFIDPILCSTKPIYAGAPNIDEIYSPLAYCKVDLDSSTIVNDIKEMVKDKPDTQVLVLNRQTYFNDYNLYKKLKEILC